MQDNKKAIAIKPHSILLMCGPTNCGKDYFIDNVLIPQLRITENAGIKKWNIQHISSDKTRREILGDETKHKHDDGMLYVSASAFNLLFEKLKSTTTYPVNAEFVILNTTGLDEEFRKRVKEISVENHYNIYIFLFDYKDREEYFKHAETDVDINKKVISKHIRRLKDEVLKSISKEKYTDSFKIKSTDFSDVEIVVEDVDKFYSHFLEKNVDEFTVIGDIHGCFDEFIQLIEKNGFVVDKDKMEIVEDSVNKQKEKSNELSDN